VGVAKTVLAELTDDTNVARGFSESLLLISGAVGQIIGSGILLMHLADISGLSLVASYRVHRIAGQITSSSHSPSGPEYPYFLPCVIETIDLKPSTTGRTGLQFEERVEQPLPPRSTLRPVVISIANQAVFVFLSIAASTLMPLVWSMSIKFGGLGLAPGSIGLWISAYGCISAFFPRIVARLGLRRVVVAAVAALGVIFVLHPLEDMLLARGAAAAAAVVWPLRRRAAALIVIRVRHGVVLLAVDMTSTTFRSC
jgi:hypothetical protein